MHKHLRRHSWVVAHHKDGDEIWLYELGWKSQLAGLVVAVYDEIDAHLTHHWLCGQNLPDVFWRIPAGRPDYDPEDGLLNNSIASKVWEFGNKLLLFADRFERDDEVAKVPVSKEIFIELAPGLAFLYEDDEEETCQTSATAPQT